MIIIAKKKYGSFNIMSVQANNLYEANHKYTYLDKYGNEKPTSLICGRAVMNDSIFTRYMIDHGISINDRGNCYDFVVVKYDYSVKAYNGRKAVSVKDLRMQNYKDGITITWNDKMKPIKYKILYRSADKAKKGWCTFIRKELWKTAIDYLTMGLYDKMPEENANLVGMSAYSTLITATAKDYIKISTKNILIVEDVDSFIKKKALSVYMENGNCKVKEEDRLITNTLFDGEGIIDESIFPANMDGFIYCRSHFFKSCLFRGNIQKYFKDLYGEAYETKMVRDMFGNYKKVTDIKVIVTDNSIKWLKFKNLMGNDVREAYKYWRARMKDSGDMFSIVKTAHPSKWDNLQRTSYQMNNSLPCTDKDVLRRIAQTSIDYYNTLVTDIDVFVKHLEMNKKNAYDVSRVLIAMYKHNPDTAHLSFFKKKRTQIADELKNRRLKLGNLLQEGDNLTLCGNPLALMMKATGQDPEEEECFNVRDDGIECYTTRFADGERLAAFRSPHNSMNNIVHLYNVYPEILLKYFPKLGSNVIVVNAIHTDIQCRLNGMDFDTDMILTTNQKDIVELARESYKKYLTIVNDVPQTGTNAYPKTPEGYAEMDDTISASQDYTGRSSDVAQLALSYHADCTDKDKKKRLEEIFVICSVLAQISIDSAKRTFDIKVGQTLNRLQKECKEIAIDYKHLEPIPYKSSNDDEKYKYAIYPKFFADNKRERKKNKCKITDEEVMVYNCPMDLVQKVIDESVIDTRRSKTYQTTTYMADRIMIDKPEGYKDSYQFNRVKNEVEAYSREMMALDRREEVYHEKACDIYEEHFRKMRKWKIKKGTMWSLIVYALGDYCKNSNRLILMLYDYDPDLFLSCFKNGQN